jgi:diguanylate cyclase (GGDEF)-like protein
MRDRTAAILSGQPDAALVYRLFFVQQVCLVLVVQFAAIAVSIHFFPSLARILPDALGDMSAPLGMAALFCAFSLFFSEPGRSGMILNLSRLLAILTGLIAISILLGWALPGFVGAFAGQAASNYPATALRPATAFALLAVVSILARATNSVASFIADLIASFLCFMVLILLSEYFFVVLHVAGPSDAGITSPPTLACLVLLTVVALFRRSDQGMFSIFLGHSIGSKIARLLSPILLVLPFLREVARARLINSHLVPIHYGTALLSSIATLISFALLLFLAFRINKMEMAIHDLTLRDELTGLYNLRGFQLLAGQSLRLAQRAQTAFSVLFLDLDNLKKINDELGHEAGSAFLAETGALLNSIFRETDVIGRVGGDEFAIAGQFSETEIATIADGLEEASRMRSNKPGHPYPLSFSMGFVTSSQGSRETLKDLVSRADKAMYHQKRRKKRQTAPPAALVSNRS